MKLVILESPFSGDTGKHIGYARWAIADSLKRGEAPIASHLLYTQPGILDDDKPDERVAGIAAGLAWYGVADACVVYEDCGISPGMEQGIARARRFKLPVIVRRLTEFGSLNGALLPPDTLRTFGQDEIAGAGGMTLEEVKAASAASQALTIAESLILEGTRRELAGDRRGGRALVLAGEQIRADL